MFKTFFEAKEYITKNCIRMIDMKYCDLWGKWHHITISSKEFTKDLMSNGIGFDGSADYFIMPQQFLRLQTLVQTAIDGLFLDLKPR